MRSSRPAARVSRGCGGPRGPPGGGGRGWLAGNRSQSFLPPLHEALGMVPCHSPTGQHDARMCVCVRVCVYACACVRVHECTPRAVVCKGRS